MKVKTDFKQMVLVDHILYNKINSISKPDVHIQQVRTPIINPIPPNSNHPPTSPPPSSSLPPPPPNYPAHPTAPSSNFVRPPNYPAHPTAPISEPHPSIPIPNNEWEKQAHQWIDTFQQSNFVNYNDMDKSAQMDDNSNTGQSEAFVYTNTPQRAAIPKTIYTQSSASAPSQISFEKPMEIEYNQTPSIANEIKKAVEREKRLHIEYAPPLPHVNSKPQHNVQQQGHFSMLQPQKMELDYYTPRSVTHTMALPSSVHVPLALPPPPTIPPLPAPPTIRSLPAPTTIPAPLSITQIPTSSRDSSKNEECDECANTVEYEDKLPIAYKTNDSKALIPYNDYNSMSATPDVRKKHVFYTCTRCNTNFIKQSSLMNHNKRFHAAFDQVEKGHKRKPKEEVLPYDVPLLKQQKARGIKRRYEQNAGSNKVVAPYKPYVVEKTT